MGITTQIVSVGIVPNLATQASGATMVPVSTEERYAMEDLSALTILMKNTVLFICVKLCWVLLSMFQEIFWIQVVIAESVTTTQKAMDGGATMQSVFFKPGNVTDLKTVLMVLMRK